MVCHVLPFAKVGQYGMSLSGTAGSACHLNFSSPQPFNTK